MKEIDSLKIAYFRKVIIRWGRLNFDDFPWRKTTNRWHSLVAEIMLQRTNANQVVSVYNDFCKNYKKPTDLLKKKDNKIFKNLGLHWRETQLRELTKVLSKKDIPKDREELLKLPCIGDYIASAYRSLHAGERDVIIDSNVVRIFGRYFGFKTDGETRRKKWFKELSDRITPLNEFRQFNYGLIDFTRIICKVKPLCNSCIFRKKCNYFKVIALKSK